MNILSIQSAVAYGHVGNSAAVFPLQRLGHEVWPVATVAFSNHPAYGAWRGRVIPAAEVAELLTGIVERGALPRCDAVLSGYLGDPATGPVVVEVVARLKAANPRGLYCCDPVIGEVGRGIYVRPGVPEFITERLVPIADIVTPNPFELAHLTRANVTTLDEALAAAHALRHRGPDLVVATGLRLRDAPAWVAVLAVNATGAWIVRSPHRDLTAHGAGDLFTALFLGVFLPGREVATALGHAVAALDAILADTQATGAAELCLVMAQEAIVQPATRYPVERLR